MKRVFTAAFVAIFTLVFAAQAQAQQPFATTKQGTVAEYEVKGPGGVVMSYVRSTVTAVDLKDDRNYTVTLSAQALGADRKPLGPAQVAKTEVRDGVLTVAPDMGAGVEITGTMPSYPSDMAVGYTNDYKFTAKTMGMEVVTTGKDRVVGQESVTTPAGTFDCLKVETEMTIVVMGQTQQMKTTTWMAHGVGQVKTEVRDNAGSVMNGNTLISLKQ